MTTAHLRSISASSEIMREPACHNTQTVYYSYTYFKFSEF